jgi:hypothetical protein
MAISVLAEPYTLDTSVADSMLTFCLGHMYTHIGSSYLQPAEHMLPQSIVASAESEYCDLFLSIKLVIPFLFIIPLVILLPFVLVSTFD